MKPVWTIVLFLMCALCVACGWQTPEELGITRDPKEAALKTYAELPTAEETLTLAERGRSMFQRAGCAACHSTTDERANLAGPPLKGVAERNLSRFDHDQLETRRWLFKHIRDPMAFPGEFNNHPDYRGMVMLPHPRIPDEDMKALVEFLWMLR